MKKLLLFLPILLLILLTTLTKNSTKDLDKELFQIQENLRVLEDRYELVLLDYNYLTSPKKLIEYSNYYFEDELIQKNIKNLNWLIIDKEKLIIKDIGSINEKVQ
tara:strand:+ start:434 stop:748 length:315 start_codon:yes stop_codon:yes gene_type:complete